jgi:hypothetical protein
MNMIKTMIFLAACMLFVTNEAAAGWSSIATNAAGTQWGWAHNFAGKGEAIVAAENGCGSLDCRYRFITEKKCIAYAESRVGGMWLGLSWGNKRAQVRAGALEVCARGAPAGTCRILLDAC